MFLVPPYRARTDFLHTEQVAHFDPNVATCVPACALPGIHLLSLG